MGQLSSAELTALLAISLIGFADLFTYSLPDAFLGQALAAQGASSPQIMWSYSVTAVATEVAGVLVSVFGSSSNNSNHLS
jgi:Ca2+/Na+ antiporter